MQDHHQRSASTSSTSLLDDDFNRRVLDYAQNEDNDTSTYLQTAKQVLDELSPLATTGSDLNLAALPILQSMLDNAPNDCGKRYVSYAIILSCESVSLARREEALTDLARYWLKFLLIPVKSAYRNYSPSNSGQLYPRRPSIKIPTDADSSRLFKRQNGECATIGARSICADGAHIIKRSLATANPKATGISPCRLMTRDIITNFSGIPIEYLDAVIDSPVNGIYSELSMHRAFEDFKWCLIPTGPDTPNRYTVKWFCPPLDLYEFAKRDFVEFRNHHDQHIELPNPEFIALHAAVAHILHESGVGECLDNLMENFIPEGTPVNRKKFTERDLALRLSLRALAGDDWSQLPNKIVVN